MITVTLSRQMRNTNLLQNINSIYSKNKLVSTITKQDFSSYGVYTYISECQATEYAKQLTVYLHDSTGLPWWATIILTTTAFRTCVTFPLSIYQCYIMSKIENISLLEMPDIAKDTQKEIAKKAREQKWTEQKAKFQFKREMKRKWDELIIRDNCHPFKASITIWFQLPAWVFYSAALRNMAFMLPHKDAAAQILYLQLSLGGILWIPNLTQPDGSLIMPVLLGLSNLALIEMQVLRRIKEPTRWQRYVTNFFRAISIALVPISTTVPSAVCLYWTTSSIIGLIHNTILISNRFRRLCGVPDTPSTLDHPYLQLISDFKDKWRKPKKVT